jgi:hypothetical protein
MIGLGESQSYSSRIYSIAVLRIIHVDRRVSKCSPRVRKIVVKNDSSQTAIQKIFTSSMAQSKSSARNSGGKMNAWRESFNRML